MADTFDPYHRWLGVPPGERPPNHYALLGLGPFEDDSDAISNSADRQMAHVRTYQTGPHGTVSQQILNELSTARLCLLSQKQKRAYDLQLRAKLSTSPAAARAPVPIAPIIPPAPLGSPISALPAVKVLSSSTGGAVASRQRMPGVPIWSLPATGGLIAGMLLTGLIALTFRGTGRQAPTTITEEKPGTPEHHRAGADERHYRPLPTTKPAEEEVSRDVERPERFASIEPPSPLGVTAEKLVLWNHRNGQYNDRGTEKCNVRLYLAGREIWSESDLEVQVMRQGENLALGCPVRDSGIFGEWRHGNRITDGITSSAGENVGYWLLPHQVPGWVEIDMACVDPQVGSANRRLGEYLSLIEGDWPRGLAWLSRGDDPDLRVLARADSSSNSWSQPSPSAAREGDAAKVAMTVAIG